MDAFQGDYPIGETMVMSYGGSPMCEHTLSKDDKNPVFVKDLSSEAREKLGILLTASRDTKVLSQSLKYLQIYRLIMGEIYFSHFFWLQWLSTTFMVIR